MIKIIFILLILVFLSTYSKDANTESITARSQKVYTVPSNIQTLIDYDSGTNPIYIGKAAKYVNTNESKWFIIKITWDANDNPTSIKSIDNAVWDDRATLGYS